MYRWLGTGICLAGWLLLLAAVIAPLVAIVTGAFSADRIDVALMRPPTPLSLLARSLTLALIAAISALLLGIAPAAVLGGAGRHRSLLLGLILTPILIPPQVYSYAWGLLTAPQGIMGGFAPGDPSTPWLGHAARAGLVSAGWLWPLVAVILAAGWRSGGRGVYELALLDTSRGRAFVRAVLPSIAPHVLAAAAAVFAIATLEYPIPHLERSRVYATEIMVLVEVGAAPAQIIHMGLIAAGMVAVPLLLAGWLLHRTRGWGESDAEGGFPLATPRAARRHGLMAFTAIIWLATVAGPVWALLAWLRDPGAWRLGFVLLSDEWFNSIGVALAAGLLSMVLAAGVMLPAAASRSPWRWGGWIGAAAVLLAAIVPPGVLAEAFIAIFNRPRVVGIRMPEWVGRLYSDTPVVWVLAVTGRYAGLAVLLCWLGLRRQDVSAGEQARVDGAGGREVLTAVILPAAARTLIAAGLLVAALVMFEVVISHMVSPPGYNAVAISLLNNMHYGRDDVVITTSLVIVTMNVMLCVAGARLLSRRRPG